MKTKNLRLYTHIIDTLRGYTLLQMPLLSEEQALLTRAIKHLSPVHTLQAQRYVKEAERLLSL